MLYLASENSRHFASPALISRQPMKTERAQKFNTDDVSLTGCDFLLTNPDLPTDASSVWSLRSLLRSHFAGWQAKWYVVAKCLPFSHSFAIPYYNICAGVLGHNFDLNFDATQTAEECNFFKNSSEY